MIINLTREEFRERMTKAKYLSSVLVKLDEYFKEVNDKKTITSDCGKIEVFLYPNSNISIRVCTNEDDTTKSTTMVALLSYRDISNSNSVGQVSAYYSPLNKTSSVCYFWDYKIDYPYDHDEAKYFQNSTRYDLPEEYFYEESCEFLQHIKDYNIVGMQIQFAELTDGHIKAIDLLLEQLGINDA